MTSISHMEARCPSCGTDIRQQISEGHIGIGDCEDVMDFECPNEFCQEELSVELVARFEVQTL